MIIHETDRCRGLNLSLDDDDTLWIICGCEMIVIDKMQAAQLITALQLYINNDFKNDEVE